MHLTILRSNESSDNVPVLTHPEQCQNSRLASFGAMRVRLSCLLPCRD
jgi:hypothetical protein